MSYGTIMVVAELSWFCYIIIFIMSYLDSTMILCFDLYFILCFIHFNMNI